MNEIICHLRDTEREIHQLQLNLLLEVKAASSHALRPGFGQMKENT